MSNRQQRFYREETFVSIALNVYQFLLLIPMKSKGFFSKAFEAAAESESFLCD